MTDSTPTREPITIAVTKPLTRHRLLALGLICAMAFVHLGVLATASSLIDPVEHPIAFSFLFIAGLVMAVLIASAGHIVGKLAEPRNETVREAVVGTAEEALAFIDQAKKDGVL